MPNRYAEQCQEAEVTGCQLMVNGVPSFSSRNEVGTFTRGSSYTTRPSGFIETVFFSAAIVLSV